MSGRYRIVHDRVICVVQKNTANISSNVINYQRSGKSGKSIQYMFEVPDQVFHFVSIISSILPKIHIHTDKNPTI